MKQAFKNTGFFFLGSALMLSVYSCNNNASAPTTNATDTTATHPADNTAQTAPADTTAQNSNMSANGDAGFVTDAAKSNADEIQMLQAGVDKGTDKKLKEDAKKMLADHKDLAKKMSDYAQKKNISLPNTAGNMDMNDMNNKTGKDWDKAWADKMVDGHQQTISKFESAQNTVTDPDLKKIITNTLPTLHKHLDMVQKLQKDLK